MRIVASAFAVAGFCAAIGSAVAADGGPVSGKWLLDCPASSGEKRCVAAHEVVVPTGEGGTKGRMLRLTLIRNDASSYTLHALVPLGVYLPAGIASVVDDSVQAKMIVQRCTQVGCEATQQLTEAQVGLLRKGKQVRVGFKVEPKGEAVAVAVPLAGLAPLIDKLK